MKGGDVSEEAERGDSGTLRGADEEWGGEVGGAL